MRIWHVHMSELVWKHHGPHPCVHFLLQYFCLHNYSRFLYFATSQTQTIGDSKMATSTWKHLCEVNDFTFMATQNHSVKAKRPDRVLCSWDQGQRVVDSMAEDPHWSSRTKSQNHLHKSCTTCIQYRPW